MTTTVTILAGQCVCTCNLSTRDRKGQEDLMCVNSLGYIVRPYLGREGGREGRKEKGREGNKKSKFKFNGMIVNIVNLT